MVHTSKVHCSIDIESYSECPLKKAGLYRYAEDPTTEILAVCYGFSDREEVHCWIPLNEWEVPFEALPTRIDGEIHFGPECPDDLEEHIYAGRQLRAWNAQFERVMLNQHAGRAIGFPPTEIDQWMCVAAKAAAVSLPRALGNAAKALGTHPKDEDGRNIMLSLARPRAGKVKRYTPESHPDKYRITYDYCGDDVRAERGIDKEIPELSPRETRAFFLDQRINERGVAVDLESVSNALSLVKQYRGILEDKCREWTGYGPGQTGKLADWIRNEGYPIDNLQAPTIKEALQNPECPPNVRRVLRLRSIHSMKAVDKYPAIERAVTKDGRIHGMFLYCGAGTGRWSSLIVQLQNLFRPHKDVEADVAIESFRIRDIKWVDSLFDVDPMIVLASCVRGMLVPKKGSDILALDYSQIEARVLAWLAGQLDLIDTFLRGLDVYKHAASGIFDVLYEAVTDHQRFIGKIAILALGYQGGKKAFAKMAKQHGVEIAESLAEQTKVDWRAANRKIVKLWYKMEEAAVAAIMNPGKVYGVSGKKIMFKVEGRFLFMRLPSGRRLAYLDPQLNSEGQMTYMGVDTYSRRWMRCETYGGKLTENAVQAIARDLLLTGMFNLDDAGYDLIGTVHDEALMEIEEGFGSMEEASELMCTQDKWAADIPIKAEGFRAKRYRK